MISVISKNLEVKKAKLYFYLVHLHNFTWCEDRPKDVNEAKNTYSGSEFKI